MKIKCSFIICRLFILSCFSVDVLAQSNSSSSPTLYSQAKFSKKILFLENVGQVVDQHSARRYDIQFKLELTNGLNCFIGNGEIHYQFCRPVSNSYQRTSILPSFDLFRLDMELVGSNKNAEIITEKDQDYYETYNTFPFSHTNGVAAQGYKKVIYKNVYPNIDWVLYVNNNGVEYDFVINRGGRVSDIRLRYKGVTDLIENLDKSISAICPMGVITEQAPIAYQYNDKKIASRFVLNDAILSFQTEQYEGTLVIDPILHWSTYFGGNGSDFSQGAACDQANNVYLTGWTNSTSNIATTGAYQTTIAGTNDVYLAKFNSAGSLLWSTYFGGAGSDQANGVACDPSGNVFIIGNTASSSNIATTGAHQTTYGGSTDAFLVKFDSIGQMQWGTYYGGTSGEVGSGVACDGSGNVFITGNSMSSSSIASIGAYQSSYSDSTDAFLVKFNSSGSRIWGTYYGNQSQDHGLGVACDVLGNVYMTGKTKSQNSIASTGAYQSSYGGGVFDAFLVKFSPAGSRIWGTYYGGSGSDEGYGITLDGIGDIYITGVSTSTNGIASANSFQSTFAGGNDNNAFLAKFTSAGSRIWGTYYGGSGLCSGKAVCTDFVNNVFVSGVIYNTATNIASPGAYRTSFAGGTFDGFLVKFNSSGLRKWGTYFGGSNDEHTSVTTDALGNIYLSGYTNSTANIATSNPYQQSYGGGGNDAFLVKFSPDSLLISQPYIDTVLCAGDTLNVNFIYNITFPPYNNTFIVQLSNASGSFSNPITIGINSATTSDSIQCTIPINTANGYHYRIRIVSNNTLDTSLNNGVDIHIVSLNNLSSTSNSPICTGDSLKLYGIDTISGIHWQWEGPNNFSDTIKNTFKYPVSLTDSGNYIVTATIGNCIASDTLHAVVNLHPSTPTAGNNSPICEGDSLKLTATGSTSGVSWQWIGPNSFNSSSQNPVRINAPLIDSGKYIVKATLNGCSSEPDTTQVVIAPLSIPTVSITSQPTVIVPGHTDTFTAVVNSACDSPSYQWYVNGVMISGATSNPYHTVLALNNTISVRVHCKGCVSPDTASSNTMTALSVGNLQLATGSLNVWPNPVGESLTLSLSEGEGTVRLYNAIGQLLYSGNIRQEIIIDTRNFVKGLYFLEVVSASGERMLRKLVKD